ncbi:MAG: hypothetical protein ORN58_05105, partial [Sediminibacterium sp.]|nr:hypothetical protein [Sediminibacterium sp.]
MKLSAGYYHSLGLKSDGGMVAWGYNGIGQTDVPAGLNNIKQLEGGYYHTVVLKHDGTVVGFGDTINNGKPAKVPVNLINVKKIAAGMYHSLALKNDSTITAWGDTSFNCSIIPFGLKNVLDISSGAGSQHNFALYKLSVATEVVNGIISNSFFVKKGDNIRITYQAQDGYSLDYILVNGNKIYDSTNGYTLRNLSSYQHIKAVFISIKVISANSG